MSEIRPGVKPRKKSVTAYTPRKPYLKFWQSPSTFFRDAVRHLKSTVTRESAFEKPYLDLEYPTMHLNLPYPDWPRGSRFEPGDVAPTKGELVTGSSCKYCIITCYGDRASSNSECPETYGWCHISVACTSAPQLGEANPGDVGWSIDGPVLSVEEDSMDGINIYVDWDAVEADADGTKTAAFTATLTDGLGHVCTDEFEVECPSGCDCGTVTPFTFDDASTPDTITQGAPESTITIVCTDGCGPYTWSVTGTGFTIDSPTSVPSTTLRASSSACGTATITATDACGTVLNIEIRCTTGSWSGVTTGCKLSGVAYQTRTVSAPYVYYSATQGRYKQLEYVKHAWTTNDPSVSCSGTPCDGFCTVSPCFDCGQGDCLTGLEEKCFGPQPPTYCYCRWYLKWQEWRC